MRHLLVLAHPNPKSFSATVAQKVEEALRARGDTVTVRNLYDLKFDPVLSATDLGAIYAGKLPDDIAREQRLVAEADNVIFVYPVWWTGMPAIMKGYVDRVFTYGFAYAVENGGIKPLLKGRRALLLSTQGTPNEIYDQGGMHQAMDLTTNRGIFEFCGFEVAGHEYFGAVPSATDADRAQMLARLPALLDRLASR
jgi:NAD(P)H dehydrogenase (quinone)